MKRALMRKNLIPIVISQENYLHLKKLGSTGDSFNDVVTKLLQTGNIGGKKINTVSLGSDMGLMGDVDGHQKPITLLTQPRTNTK